MMIQTTAYAQNEYLKHLRLVDTSPEKISRPLTQYEKDQADEAFILIASNAAGVVGAVFMMISIGLAAYKMAGWGAVVAIPALAGMIGSFRLYRKQVSA